MPEALLGDPVATAEGDLIINMGPQHPSTHGVLHLVVTLNGETIKKVEPHLGFIHRSIEKMCESLSYRQFTSTLGLRQPLQIFYHITSSGGADMF